MQTPSLIVNQATVKQQHKALLDGLSFTLNDGDHLAISGNSGSGKSTLARAIAGRIFFQGGIEINYTSEVIPTPSTILIEAAASFKNLSNTGDFYYQQRYNSFDAEDALTVEEELLRSGELTAGMRELLDTLQLAHRLHTPLIQLSNGEQKKLQLVRAFRQQPQVLLLDNVFVGLDAASRNSVHALLDRYAATGTLVIMIADLRTLPSCINKLLVLENGKAVAFRGLTAADRIPHDKELISEITIPAAARTVHQHYDQIVCMQDVTIQYGEKLVLSDINWRISQGEHWLVKGHNGAGKSTLLSLITADNPQAYSQSIWLFDQRRGSGESIWDIKKKIGFVSPELHKFFDSGSSVHHVIASGFFDTMGLFKRLTAEQEAITNEWMAFFELTSVAGRALHLLSAGQQRRAILARALVKNPPLLVLDEPCQGLDEHQTQQFLSLIDAVCQSGNTTLIYVTHVDHEIPACISHKLELEAGRQINLYPGQAMTA